MYDAKLSEKSIAVAADLAYATQKMMAEVAQKKIPFTPQINRKMANDFFIAHSGTGEKLERVENLAIPTADGCQISLRKYIPAHSSTNFVLMFVHGGGWIQGNLDSHDYLCGKIANLLRIDVVAVDYRLAPEFIFPTPLDDILDAYKWCVANFSDRNIIISGDSAGGNLCAALCIKIAEEKKLQKPSSQLLFYPALSNDFESESFKVYENNVLTKSGTMFCFSSYAGKSCLDADVMANKFVYPLLQEDMNVFPKTILVPAECDILLDGQTTFYKKLKSAGIDAEIVKTAGTVHGFMTYGRDFEEEIIYVLETARRLVLGER
jgi:acetyl esterase